MSPFTYTFPFAFEPVAIKARVLVAFSTNPFASTATWGTLNTYNPILSFSTKRGRQHELDRVEAGEAVIKCRNPKSGYSPYNGSLWPDNTSGRYYPDVKVGKRIRVQTSFDNGTTYHNLFDGFIESYGVDWQGMGGMEPLMTITATDVFGNLAGLKINDTSGFATEKSGTRVGNILDKLSANIGRDLDVGQEDVVSTGALTNTNALDHLRSVMESEPGFIFVATDGDVQYHDRTKRSTASVDAIFGDDSPENEYHHIGLVLDKSILYNEVRGQRGGGTEQVASDASSQTTYGQRVLSQGSLLLTSDQSVLTHCTYLLARHKDAKMRTEYLEIMPDTNKANLYPKVFDFDLGTKMTVRLNQASLNTNYFIEGIEHNFDAEQQLWQTRWQLSDADQYLFTPSAVTWTFRPSASGNYTGLSQSPSTGSNWDKVDDVSADGDTTYVFNPGTAVATYDLYALPDTAYSQGTINSVSIGIRVSPGASAGGAAKTYLRTVSTNYSLSVTALSSGYNNYSNVYTTNPNTATTWTWAQINDMQIGVELAPPIGSDVRCTQVWAEVRYTPAW